MTIKQAAMWLCQPGIVSMIHDPTTKKALSVAVKALAESELSTNLAEVGTDAISRQAAIDALARMMPRSYTPDGSHPADEEIFRAQEVFADCIEALEILPSAQPATNCSEFPNNSDTISRQAAIEALRRKA